MLCTTAPDSRASGAMRRMFMGRGSPRTGLLADYAGLGARGKGALARRRGFGAGFAGRLAGEPVTDMEDASEKDAEAQARENRLRDVQERIDGQKQALDDRHLDAARREGNDEIVRINPRTGEAYDHVSDVRNSQKGLFNIIKVIRNRLGYTDLDPLERAALEHKLSEASRLLDHSEQFVPR